MGKVKKFFSDINKSKFKSLYVKNFLFAVSILIVVLFAAITFNDIWLNIIGIFVLFGFSYLTFNVRAIEQNKLYEEVTGVITGYKEKAKADVLTPRLISEECSFIVETDNEKTYEILLPRLELKTRGILLQEGGPKYWIGKQITFYYRDDPSKPFHYDINERKAGSKDGKEILKFSLDIIIIACLVAAGYFGLKIFERFQEDQQLNSSYESIRKDTKTGKHINWNKLKKINSDIVAWIYVKGTNIDYPVVQGKTNQSYLHTNFKKQYTYGGCIFLDSKDNKQFALNDNNVFYGHHMRNGSMFADLVKFREEKFARKHTIELYTPDKTYHLKAFSAYAKTADTSIPITFKNQEEKNAYITKLKNRNGVSSIIKNIPKKNEPIYTFATCSYEGHDYRTYVHAVEK